MKKILALLLASVMVLGLAACGGDNTPAEDTDAGTKEPATTTETSANDIPDSMTSEDGKYELAFVTDVGQLKDKSFNEGTWNGVKLYASKNDMSYKYYQPANGDQATDDDRYEAMKAAVDGGATVVVCAGFLQEAALKQAAIDLVYTQSNLQGILEKENFDTFSYDYYADDIYDNTQLSSLEAARNAVVQCHRFVDTFDDTFENLLLFGDTGVGKTFLSNCVAKELLDTGHSVIYFSAHHLFELLAQKTFTREPQAAESYRNIFDCDLLIIDDLGTELTNTFTTSQFFVCLNERIRKQKSTLISTNLELFDIASIYSERIFSRISNSFIILHLFGNDIRLCKKLTEK